ncbi:hypothetical protein KKF63_05830 [bacterium]|nr:hypothetical protein [bacterium]
MNIINSILNIRKEYRLKIFAFHIVTLIILFIIGMINLNALYLTFLAIAPAYFLISLCCLVIKKCERFRKEYIFVFWNIFVHSLIFILILATEPEIHALSAILYYGALILYALNIILCIAAVIKE